MAIPNAAVQCDRTALHAEAVEAALLDRSRALSTTLALLATNSQQITRAAGIIAEALAAGHLVMVCGNGGSAAEAQHLPASSSGRFRREQRALAGDGIDGGLGGLDRGRQRLGLRDCLRTTGGCVGHHGDVLVGISTSGESSNVVNAACQARDRGMSVIALTGREPTRLGLFSNVAIAVPATRDRARPGSPPVLVHLISEIVESSLAQQTIERTPVDESRALPLTGTGR